MAAPQTTHTEARRVRELPVRAAAVVDEHRLAELVGQLRRDHAAEHVVAAARRERDDQADRHEDR